MLNPEYIIQRSRHKKEYKYLASNFIHDQQGSPTVEYSFSVSDGIILSSRFNFNDNNRLSLSKLPRKVQPSDLMRFLERKFQRESLTHQLGFIEVFEQLYGLSNVLSPTHKALKMIIAECDRVINHCQWLIELCKNTGLRYLGNDFYKIKILGTRFLKTLIAQGPCTGSIHLSDFMNVGEFSKEITKAKFEESCQLFGELEYIFSDLKEKVLFNHQLRKVLIGIGLLITGLAEKTNSVGPIARASGIPYDLRAQDPYWDYLEIDSFKIAVSYDQDLFGNLKVILNEIHESLSIINQFLERLELNHTENLLSDVNLDQKGHFSIRLEAANGPAVYHVDCEEGMQIKGFGMSTAALTNLQSLESRLLGQPVVHASRIVHAYNLVQFGFYSS